MIFIVHHKLSVDCSHYYFFLLFFAIFQLELANKMGSLGYLWHTTSPAELPRFVLYVKACAHAHTRTHARTHAHTHTRTHTHARKWRQVQMNGAI